MTLSEGTALARLREISEAFKAHVEIRFSGGEHYVYEDGGRILSNVDGITYGCPFGVPQDRACEDDSCAECAFRSVQGKDIICTWDPEKEPAEPCSVQRSRSGHGSEPCAGSKRAEARKL